MVKYLYKRCLNCGISFKVHSAELKRGKGKYCSPQCATSCPIRNKRISESHKGVKMPQISGKNHPNWKGGKRKCDNRWIILKPDHPFSDSRGYIFQSRLIAERYLGRYLKRREVIHHINGNTLDDRPKNLYLFPSQSAHSSYEGLKNKPVLISNLL